MNIGAAIKELRKERGISQKELASKCELSVNAISQIELNKTFPQKGTIQKISETLNLPASYLLFFSITDDDIPEDKRDTFNFLSGAIKKLLVRA